MRDDAAWLYFRISADVSCESTTSTDLSRYTTHCARLKFLLASPLVGGFLHEAMYDFLGIAWAVSTPMLGAVKE